MAVIITKPDTETKLKILSADGQYDLACACGTNKDDRRHRGDDGKWIYPITLPNGGKSILFKSLISNHCGNDCKYCPLRAKMDMQRCSLTPAETAQVFMDYYKRKKVFGLFLSSAVRKNPDSTMEKLNATAEILRKQHAFRGFIHLKIMAGASANAIERALSLSSAVSVNIETPGEKYMQKLSDRKNYLTDIIEPIKLISRLTSRGSKYSRVKQSTQFIVGPAGERDADIVKYSAALYERLGMKRIYFSSYQAGLGDTSLPAESAAPPPEDTFVREHRLYQVDFLLRRYSFSGSDIFFDAEGNLSLTTDPKQTFADRHPEMFPVNINRAGKIALLRVPGLGPTTVSRIIKRRAQSALRRIEDIAKPNKLLLKAEKYLVF
jgi:predicted DNA-binding helix-hairpin-helix protein